MTVQRRSTLVPGATPVTVVVGKEGLVMIAEPDSSVHKPVPGDALLADRVHIELLHKSWSSPAFATTGLIRLVKVTASVVTQTPRVTVQRSVTLCPTGTPVTALVGEILSTIVAPWSGPTNVHMPLAPAGEAAAVR